MLELWEETVTMFGVSGTTIHEIKHVGLSSSLGFIKEAPQSCWLGIKSGTKQCGDYTELGTVTLTTTAATTPCPRPASERTSWCLLVVAAGAGEEFALYSTTRA